jgi:1,4-alpha-glucan branching enzyme
MISLYPKGISKVFTSQYEEYFNANLDGDSILYLMLANYLIHEVSPYQAISIAEDVSGMPTLCRKIEDGGIGFDYRLGMAVPDMVTPFFQSLTI